MNAIANNLTQQQQRPTGQPENKLARLDAIETSVYSGGVLEWYNWRAKFENVVVKGRNFSEAILYTYLMHWTSGQARTAIMPVANNQNAYSDAMVLLEGQFKDDDAAHAEYIKAMTNITPAKGSDVRTQRKFLNSLQTIIAGLKSLDNDPDRPELAKQHMTVISRKLPERDLVDWLRYAKTAPQFNTPTHFHEWFLGTVKVRETASLGKQTQVNQTPVKGSATSLMAGEETLFSQGGRDGGSQRGGRGASRGGRGDRENARGRGGGSQSAQANQRGGGAGRGGRGGGRSDRFAKEHQGQKFGSAKSGRGRGGGDAGKQKGQNRDGKRSQAPAFDKAKKFDLCGFDGGNHNPAYCSIGMNASREEQDAMLGQHKACRNCMRIASHTAKQCPAEKCKECGKPHHTKLHYGGKKD